MGWTGIHHQDYWKFAVFVVDLFQKEGRHLLQSIDAASYDGVIGSTAATIIDCSNGSSLAGYPCYSLHLQDMSFSIVALSTHVVVRSQLQVVSSSKISDHPRDDDDVKSGTLLFHLHCIAKTEE